MDGAIADFQNMLKGKDTVLFYYAGHGVQVEGENYLIPVKEDIQSSAQAKSRSVSLGDILDRMKASGVKTALVFLDACRDNPFPGSSRGGARGLAVVSAPSEIETCIAYATQPGSTAQDGTGRNGVFSAAMLKNLAVPGVSLSDFMTSVIADVKAKTGGKQQPRVDNGLSKPFYFVDPAIVAARAQAAFDKSKTELAGLDAKLAELQKQIASASDAQAKQKLQVEQQRQQALQQAKALEADNLAKEASKQKAAANTAATLASERAAAQAANAKAQNELSNLAVARRAELDKLAQAAASDNPDVLIDTVDRLEVVLKEVDGQYAAALQKSLNASNAGWDKQLVSMRGEQPDITETDAEFAARISKEKSELEAKRQDELARLRTAAETQRISQTATIRSQYDDTLRSLQTKVWTVTGSGMKLSIGAFDRNTRLWPFTVDSADPTIPMQPVNVVAQLGTASDPRAAILAVDAAVKANALTAEIDWTIKRDLASKRYSIVIYAVRVRNLTNDAVVVEVKPNLLAAYFTAGKRSSPIQAGVGSLVVNTKSGSGEGDVYLDGQKVGTTPLTLKLAIGPARVQVRWADLYSSFSQQARIGEGQITAVTASKGLLKAGDTGPAGGLIFYDKGGVSDGWRYLEATPKDLSAGTQWYNGNYTRIRTSTALGTGKANTDAIAAAQSEGIYAASLCKNLTLNGFSDWFLPSKDELNLMYLNLKKTGLHEFGDYWYWSSSQISDRSVWIQGFSYGINQEMDAKDITEAVRAVRAF